MRELREANTLGLATVATLTALVVLVAGVGVVGLWARYVNTWRSLFLMERVIALATPLTIALLVAGLVSAVALIARSYYTDRRNF